MIRTSDFDYHLPPERIAQTPCEPRDASRLLALRRPAGGGNVNININAAAAAADTDAAGGGAVIEHRRFRSLPDYLRAGDLMVFNRSRVLPARLYGAEIRSGARVELLLVRRQQPGVWQALGRPGRRLRAGAEVIIGPEVVGPEGAGLEGAGAASETIRATVLETHENGLRTVRLSDEAALHRLGEMPLPPYIKEKPADPERYQTVYADTPGSVAAPTAGLHFTDRMFRDIRARGATIAWVTLHVGLDTFRPVHGEDAGAHRIHTEWYELPAATAAAVNGARRAGGRVIAVGTTTVRTLEQAAQDAWRAGRTEIVAATGDADLFILPGHPFRLVDAMVTNFHLPRSTLLMLVSAFAGREAILSAYREAVAREYRFYSFGDAMLIL